MHYICTIADNNKGGPSHESQSKAQGGQHIGPSVYMAGKIARPRRAATGPQKKNPKLSKMHANRDVQAPSGPTKRRSDPGKVMEVHTWEPHIMKPPELAITLPGTRGNLLSRFREMRANMTFERLAVQQSGGSNQEKSGRCGHGSLTTWICETRLWPCLGREGIFQTSEGVGVKYPEVNPTAKNEDSRGGSERTNF